MKGAKVISLDQLIRAREMKKAITCPNTHCFKGPIPAAFMANLTGEVIHRLISEGMFIYEKERKSNVWKRILPVDSRQD